MQRSFSSGATSHAVVSIVWLILSAALFYTGTWPELFQQLNISPALIILLGLFWIGLGSQEVLWKLADAESGQYRLQERSVELFALLLPLALFWVLYSHILDHWWSYDDLDILHYVDVIGPTAGFYDPALKYNFYTPLQHFSLGIDYLLFGLDPAGYYWHHLLSMTLVLVAAYFFLRFFLPPLQLSLMLGLFVVLLPTAQITNFLMVRHYVEGLLFALVSLLFFCTGLKKQSNAMLLLGSVCYFVAALAKEIYVPLPALLLLLPAGNLVGRIRASVPYFLVAALYVALRLYMLGNDFVTAYSGQFFSWAAIRDLPVNLAARTGWQYWWQTPLLALIVAGLALSLSRRPSVRLPVSLAYLGLVLIPLLPVAARLGLFAYYLFLFGFIFAFAVIHGIVQLAGAGVFSRWQKPLSLLFFLVMMLAFTIPSLLEQSSLNQISAQQRRQEQFLLAHTNPDTVVLYGNYIADDVVHFRQKYKSEMGEINWCPVSDCLCGQFYGGMPSVRYDGNQWIAAGEVPQGCPESENDAVLQVELTMTLPDTLAWNFGPYDSSQGSFFIASTMDEFGEHLDGPKFMPVPPQGQFRFCCSPFERPFSWTIAFKSVEGWEIVSEPVRIDASVIDNGGQGRISWSGP